MLEEVMKLLNAGFTADEIRQLALSPKEDPKPAADPAPKEDPKPAADPAPKDDPKPAADPAPKEDPKPVADPVLAAIERLTGSFNAFISRSTGLDKLPSDDPEKSAEQILQEVLKGVKPKE